MIVVISISLFLLREQVQTTLIRERTFTKGTAQSRLYKHTNLQRTYFGRQELRDRDIVKMLQRCY